MTRYGLLIASAALCVGGCATAVVPWPLLCLLVALGSGAAACLSTEQCQGKQCEGDEPDPCAGPQCGPDPDYRGRSGVDRDGDGYDDDVDCNDDSAGVHPGASDDCCDSVDSDCDGFNGPPNATCNCFSEPIETDIDNDGDGWLTSEDCDDARADTHPGVLDDFCDGNDHDCDGYVDEDCYIGNPIPDDWDGDGWSSDADCDDEDPAVNPGAAEACCDAIDSDCDGHIDNDWICNCLEPPIPDAGVPIDGPDSGVGDG